MHGSLIHIAFRWLLAVAALLCAFAPTARAETEYEVKAAFTLRFADYVQWPGKRDSVVTVGIVGRDPFEGAFQRLLSENPDMAKRFRVKNVAASDAAGLRGCDIVFICNSEADRLEAIMRSVSGHPVLTVSDVPDFDTRGGGIGFNVRNSRIKFSVNEPAAAAQGLKLDKQLLIRSAR
jgi:hypothetical protein